jgi:hypothetical protein
MSNRGLGSFVSKSYNRNSNFYGGKEGNDSATSAPDSVEQAAIAALNNVPDVVSGVLYHVVLDCDYGEFVDITKRQSRAATVIGRVGSVLNNMPERLPVVRNKDDAKQIAQKLITKIVNKGSAGVGNKKKYPYLGAVIMGFQFNTESIAQRTYKQVNSYNDISKDDSEDLIYWTQNDKVRGLVSKPAMAHTKVVNAEYVAREGLNADNGFALLNTIPELSVEDVVALKCLYEGKKSDCFGEKNEIKQVDVESRGEVQLGGKYGTDYRTLAIREKAKYFVNKKMNGGNKMTGGNLNNVDMDHATEDDAYWREQYMKKKNEYLKMKKQMKNQAGGGPDDEHPTEDEEYWKNQYMKKKNEYLKMKKQAGGNKMTGGNLNNVDMDHATEDEAYWREQYMKIKAEYVNKKNHKH